MCSRIVVLMAKACSSALRRTRSPAAQHRRCRGGAQPISSDDGQLHIAYNGEVFNHPQLYEDLHAAGRPVRSRCDTETVLQIYQREGRNTPTRLRGMFAFAIWDKRRRELFLARDRFGVKPLYYALTEDGSFVFASEIKAILASGLVNASLNRRTLPDYLANHAPSGAETMFEGIKRLLSGALADVEGWSDRVAAVLGSPLFADGIAVRCTVDSESTANDFARR